MALNDKRVIGRQSDWSNGCLSSSITISQIGWWSGELPSCSLVRSPYQRILRWMDPTTVLLTFDGGRSLNTKSFLDPSFRRGFSYGSPYESFYASPYGIERIASFLLLTFRLSFLAKMILHVRWWSLQICINGPVIDFRTSRTSVWHFRILRRVYVPSVGI